MLSLQKLKMTREKVSREEVQQIRKSLEEATKEAFDKLRKAKMNSWNKSRFIVLD
ncbi:MAG: hypothetical protein UR66_C0002G0054 [Candidatus Moranbacteria bacterium GW2011_GWE1_35_17]|nr:MAG: hypothetical protein UR66_C0002G0054 [Candidatus Moranbacteria bacterium GW2011_GWE1_35_17]KKP82325.1 MAG: hypothetical protein UR83_C0053G0009 [Candidatus Moranbacteria bacterium GW2011_GWF2_35_54]KKP84350.1 MAG: hypothetical protein UR82_C0008G0023 [Candidatus Moranbacteria bacterium GW2011_GWF1_35_5]